MKTIRLNPDTLAMMFHGFSRHLFTVPKEGEMYCVEEGDYTCTIYFQENFWEKYVSELESANQQGKFALSNANESWIALLRFIKSATKGSLPESNYKDYYNLIKMYL